MIYTNQLKLELFHQAIDRDFLILKARRDQGDYRKSRVPDEALQYGQVLSVAYDWGNCCYILYRRSQADPEGLRRHLEDCDSTTIVTELKSCADREEIEPYRLAQLLLNAMHRLGRRDGYHNLSGKLYERRPGWKSKQKDGRDEFWALELALTWEHCLTMKVKSFRRVADPTAPAREPRYVMDRHSGELRRLLRDDPDKNTALYEAHPLYSDSRNNINFLCFDTLEHFESCKAGVLLRFLHDTRRLLKDYLSLDLVPMDETAHLGIDPKKREIKSVLELLKAQKVWITDLVEDASSYALTDTLRMELEKYRGITPQEGQPEPGSVVLQIIHNREYFNSHPQEADPHEQPSADCIVQHVTVEDFHPTGYNAKSKKEQEDACFKKVMLELAIKLDIHQKQLTCFRWEALGFQRPLFFVIARKDRDTGVCHYRRLEVSPTGQLSFDRWEGPGPFSDPVQNEIEAVFLTRNQKFDPTVEGLVYEDSTQLQIIRQTDRYTLPDLEALCSAIRADQPAEQLETAPLLTLARQQLQNARQREDKKAINQYEVILNTLPALGSEASRKELKTLIRMKTTAGKALNSAYHDATGKWICCGKKNAEAAEACFSGVTDIRCYREGSCTYYYSGFHRRDLQEKLVRGCRIRRVSSTGGEVQIERYLPLMEVGFVRASTWTVLPFPFKYLREWDKNNS